MEVVPNNTVPIDIALEDLDGHFGCMGMTDVETSLLYTIGVCDRSWGSFYSIAAMWFIHCTFFTLAVA